MLPFHGCAAELLCGFFHNFVLRTHGRSVNMSAMKKLLLILALGLFATGLHAQEDFVWINPIEAGAEVHGQGWKELKNTYFRLPAKAEAVVPASVWRLGKNSAGLSLVFRCNSPEILVRYKVGERQAMFHMPATGASGVDLYATDSKGERHFVSPKFAPSFKDTINYRFPGIIDPVSRKEGVMMTFRLSLPLYNTVEWLEIGIPRGKELSFVPVSGQKSIVIYGSSITQGGVASRPSMAWPSIVASQLGREVVNLGFSGSGKGEKEVFDLISEIDAGVFVIDCLPNMSLDLPIKERILYGVHKIRESHDCPILLAEYSVCGQQGAIDVKRAEETEAKNLILREVYAQLKKEGVRNIHYIKASEWEAGMDGYAEGDHPNDFGMQGLAAGMVKKLKKLLK